MVICFMTDIEEIAQKYFGIKDVWDVPDSDLEIVKVSIESIRLALEEAYVRGGEDCLSDINGESRRY